MAFLAELESAFLEGGSIADYFDLIAGTSTGGIIALALGADHSARNILKVYLNRGADVFPTGKWRNRIRGTYQYVWNRYNRDALDSMITSFFGSKQVWESKNRLCIPAAETRHFEPFIFKTPHHPDYRLDWKQPMSHVAKTTSAAPTFFSAVAGDDGYEFVDGGIWANNPIMVGIADALACFDIRREQIRVLSLGCVQDQFSVGLFRQLLGGKLFWTNVMFESMHIQSQNVVGQARLIIGGDRVSRIDAPPISPRLEMWDWDRCANELPRIANRLFDDWSKKVRLEFLERPAEEYAPYYTPDQPPAG